MLAYKKCPICEEPLKIFDFNKQEIAVEKILQCRDCGLTIHGQTHSLQFRLNDSFVKITYNDRNYSQDNELRKLNKINILVNKARRKLNKNRIVFFPRLKKLCSACGELKPLSDFYASKKTKDKRGAYCKICNTKKCRDYSFSFEGWLRNAYHTLKLHQRKRFNSELDYTKEDLRAWINIDEFDYLFENYIKSGYQKKYSVCLYRKDYEKEYTLENLQMISFEEMMEDVREKVNYKMMNEKLFARQVAQYNNGEMIKIFSSIREAERKTGSCSSNIVKVCKGKQATHHGYEWKYI